jgi:thioredoxin 1
MSGTDQEILRIRKRKMEEFMEQKNYPGTPLEVRDKDFEEIIKRYPLVVVDFWSEMCPPCRLIAPVLEELAKELHGRVVFAKMCVDQERLVASKFGISAIPTLIVFSKGRPVDRIVGFLPKGILLQKLKIHMEEG